MHHLFFPITMQLCQLITVISSNYLYKETDKKQTIMWMFNMYNAGLILLFGKFYYANYMEKIRNAFYS